MRVLWIGYGQAGGKLTDTMRGVEKKRKTKRPSYRTIAINTEVADLVTLKNADERLTIANYRLRGRGVGTNPEVGAETAEKSLSRMMDIIDRLAYILEPEAFWIAAGLAGGTGAGGGPILAEELKSFYGKPVYGLGALPSISGLPPDKSGLYFSNSLKSLAQWRQKFDNVLLIDNQRYENKENTRESVQEMYVRINKDVAKGLTSVLTAGEAKRPPQEVLSTPEITATLGSFGDISTIGHRSVPIHVRNRWWRKGIDPDDSLLEELIKGSIDKETITFPCDLSNAKAAALVTYGRPNHLYSQAIISGKAYLEQTMEMAAVRYGDYPETGSSELAATTLVSGMTDYSRFEQMRQKMEEAA